MIATGHRCRDRGPHVPRGEYRSKVAAVGVEHVGHMRSPELMRVGSTHRSPRSSIMISMRAGGCRIPRTTGWIVHHYRTVPEGSVSNVGRRSAGRSPHAQAASNRTAGPRPFRMRDSRGDGSARQASRIPQRAGRGPPGSAARRRARADHRNWFVHMSLETGWPVDSGPRIRYL